MTADSMEEKIRAFAQLARNRADQRDEDIENVVYNLIHNVYLTKHTTSDVLTELQELQDTNQKAFYNGEANDHLMTYAQ